MLPRTMTIALPAVLLLSIALLASAAGPSGNVKTKAVAAMVIPRGNVPKGARSSLWVKPTTSQPKCVGDAKMCAADEAPQILNKVAGGVCPDYDQCSFLERFSANSGRWVAANGYANGEPFNSWWSGSKAVINIGAKRAFVTVDKVPGFGKQFRSGQLQTKKWHGYGCYEVRMKPVKQQGLISTFFTYTGKWDNAAGASGAHNEVDIEFVWKKKQGKLMMQANYFTNGGGGNERYINLKFDPSKKLHNYAFKWTEKKIVWFVDGKKVYSSWKNTPKATAGHHKIMMNFWPVTPMAAGWGGYYAYDGPRTVVYEAVRFTRGSKCKIVNKF